MRKYRVEYLPIAMQDMVDIAAYISHELDNPDAAETLSKKLIAAGDTLSGYPYKNGVYHPVKECAHEDRRVLVENYGMYYWIDEEIQTVTVARVIYQRRDLDKFL